MIQFNRGHSIRQGRVNLLVLFLGSVILVLALSWIALQLRPNAQRNLKDQSIVRVYCASGIAKPVEQIIKRYNAEYDANVEIVRTGGSGELAGQIKTEFETGLMGGADLYVTADDILLAKAHDQGVVAERFTLAEQKPVIAVPVGSEFQISNIRQLVETKDLRFGIASQRAAVGKLARQIAKREGVAELLETKKATDSENVMTLAQALVAGSLDAAIVWDTTVSQLNQANPKPVLQIAALADAKDEIKSNIGVGVLSTTTVPTACLKFARFLTGSPAARESFESFGFTYVQGDVWEEVPEIHLYCGSMFTPVLEEPVREFATREGINIYPRWEGCGKLVASMKSIQDPELFPDAYLACDVSFLDEVQDQFESPTTISHNQLVLAVRREIESEINDASDLLNLNLRVGICDPMQSALGQLTKRMLSRPPYEGLYEKLEKSSAVTVDVGPTLISQLLANGLDVAIVYRSNVMASEKSLESIKIIEIGKQASFAKATQPWAISKTTKNPQLMGRFFDWIGREEIQKRFQDHGFGLPDEDRLGDTTQ